MQKHLILWGALGACLALAGVAYAGYARSEQVRVTSTAAYGTTDGARYSENSTEYIMCSVNGTRLVTYSRCAARDAQGDYLSCYSQDDRIAQAAAAVGASSRIYFSVDSSGGCQNVQIANGSPYLP